MMMNYQIQHTSHKKHTLPSVVQIGLSGSRELFEGVLTDAPQALQLCADIETWLETRFAEIRNELRLDDNQFFVGISQAACGADTIFTKLCKSRSIPQRFLLPEHPQQFLSAVEVNGTPDFTPRQRAEALALLGSEHVIEVRMVASSSRRASRFEETNVEIMRISDAMVCLLRADADGKLGGTRQLLNRAIGRGIPVLEIQVAERSGSFAIVVDQWHNLPNDTSKPIQNLSEDMARLSFPPLVSGQEPIPQHDEYCDMLTSLATFHAKSKQRLFKRGAVVIIVTHILATVLATITLALHGAAPSTKSGSLHGFMMAILLAELFSLLVGFQVHRFLHHSRAVPAWANARVVCELVRSLQAIGSRHLYLEHLFRIPLPTAYRPLLRTLSVLHLHATWPQRDQPWQPLRDHYIQHRFDDLQHGQLHFFEKALEKDERLMQICQSTFMYCTLFAMCATGIEFVLFLIHPNEDLWLAIFGALAVTLPVLAVGGLSWAAAVDCEARIETFGETLHFLRRQRPYLQQANSATEFDHLLLETETVLLSETANWYSRRTTKGVT